MKRKQIQGRTANRIGKMNEGIVEAALKISGFIENDKIKGYKKQSLYYNPYNKSNKGRVDFVIWDNQDLSTPFSLTIEVRTQTKSGSVIEKLPAIVDKFIDVCYPTEKMVLVYSGDVMESAISMLRKRIVRDKIEHFYIYDIEDFCDLLKTGEYRWSF